MCYRPPRLARHFKSELRPDSSKSRTYRFIETSTIWPPVDAEVTGARKPLSPRAISRSWVTIPPSPSTAGIGPAMVCRERILLAKCMDSCGIDNVTKDDRIAWWLETIYVLSFFVQLAAMIAGAVGCLA